MSSLIKYGRHIAKRILYYGNKRYCNVCQRNWRRFLPFGVIPRDDARCPSCNSLERHRLVWEFFQRKTDLFDDRAKSVLHVAPEKCFVSMLRESIGAGYVTADLMDPSADKQWDITAIPQPNESFDVIYCSHVLEHIPSDRQAMAEFHRVLKPEGWAVLNVPITADVTFEDPTITDPKERERLFGQFDHVRRYGPDYVERLQYAGFHVKTISKSDVFSPKDIIRLGLRNELTGDIFYCTK